VNYAAALEEFDGAPDGTDAQALQSWIHERTCIRTKIAFRLSCIRLLSESGEWHGSAFENCALRGWLPDALSELLEFCARMVEIERCDYVDLLGQHGPPGCERCPHRPAEYRTCSDGVGRWV
jgi:hypothetical protein